MSNNPSGEPDDGVLLAEYPGAAVVYQFWGRDGAEAWAQWARGTPGVEVRVRRADEHAGGFGEWYVVVFNVAERPDLEVIDGA